MYFHEASLRSLTVHLLYILAFLLFNPYFGRSQVMFVIICFAGRVSTEKSLVLGCMSGVAKLKLLWWSCVGLNISVFGHVSAVAKFSLLCWSCVDLKTFGVWPCVGRSQI